MLSNLQLKTINQKTQHTVKHSSSVEKERMITITDKGAERVNHFLETRQAGIGIRVKITTTGCSGYAYQLEFADETNSEDTILRIKWSKDYR